MCSFFNYLFIFTTSLDYFLNNNEDKIVIQDNITTDDVSLLGENVGNFDISEQVYPLR